MRWNSTVSPCAHTDKLSRHLAPECPEGVLDSLGDGQIDFRDFQFHDDLRRLLALDRGRHQRRIGQDRFHR